MEKEFDYQGIGRAFNEAFASEKVIIFGVVPRYSCGQSYGSDENYSCAVFAAARSLPEIEGALYGTRADGTRFMLCGGLMILEYTGNIKVSKEEVMPTFDYNGKLKQVYFMPTIAKALAATLMPATFKAEWPTDEELRFKREVNISKAEKIKKDNIEAARIRDNYRANLHAGKPETPESIALYEASANFDFTFEYNDDHRHYTNTRREMHSLVERMRDAGLNVKAFTDRVANYSE